MEEGFFAIEGESSERNIGNDGDVDMQLGQARRNGGIITRDLIPELYAAIFVKKENDEAAALTARSVSRQGPAIRLPRRYEGESSSNSAGNLTLANGDLQHKRAKVYSASTGHYVTTASSDAGASSSLAGGDYNINQESSVQGTREIFYNYFMWNSGGDENPFDGTGGNDDDDDDDSKTEDLEIRMDLTDDLLHMVFSFLDYGDLCRASMVCRQWRAASAHEDFWRCLKFENRKISIEQSAPVSVQTTIDPIHVPVGPITRHRAQKIKDAMAGLAQRHVAELNKHVRDQLDFKEEGSRVIYLTQVIEEQHGSFSVIQTYFLHIIIYLHDPTFSA